MQISIICKNKNLFKFYHKFFSIQIKIRIIFFFKLILKFFSFKLKNLIGSSYLLHPLSAYNLVRLQISFFKPFFLIFQQGFFEELELKRSKFYLASPVLLSKNFFKNFYHLPKTKKNILFSTTDKNEFAIFRKIYSNIIYFNPANLFLLYKQINTKILNLLKKHNSILINF